MTDCPECKRNIETGLGANDGKDAMSPCPHCGAVVAPSSPAAESDQAAAAPEMSVSAMSPGYPRYRNALIIAIFIGVVVALLGGIHLASRGVQEVVWDFARNPVSRIMSLVIGSDRYEVCRSFVKRHPGRFAMLGTDLELFPVRHEVRVVNGKKTATIVARVSGTKGSGEVTFRLKERHGKWRVRQAALTTGDGREYGLYP